MCTKSDQEPTEIPSRMYCVIPSRMCCVIPSRMYFHVCCLICCGGLHPTWHHLYCIQQKNSECSLGWGSSFLNLWHFLGRGPSFTMAMDIQIFPVLRFFPRCKSFPVLILEPSFHIEGKKKWSTVKERYETSLRNNRSALKMLLYNWALHWPTWQKCCRNKTLVLQRNGRLVLSRHRSEEQPCSCASEAAWHNACCSEGAQTLVHLFISPSPPHSETCLSLILAATLFRFQPSDSCSKKSPHRKHTGWTTLFLLEQCKQLLQGEFQEDCAWQGKLTK